jgi:uncharacterized protein (TIGR00288 family)
VEQTIKAPTMTKQRIAALFDAENIPCLFAAQVLSQLRLTNIVQSACAVGDFTLLSGWMECARENGIDLVMQPGLGKGKNSADIRLTIEAMDLVYRGRPDAIALISRDRDFTPLAFRLRESGLSVVGFSPEEPSPAFRAACSSFHVLQASGPIKASPSVLTAREINELRRILARACSEGAVDHQALGQAVRSQAPQTAQKLQGKFLKSLVANGLVTRIGSGAGQRFKMAG